MKDTTIDFSVLEEIKSLPLPSGNALVECLDAFLDCSHTNFEQLSACIQSSDFVGVYGRAHAMKGACANLGLNGLKELFYAIEEAAKKESGNDLDTLYNRATTAFEFVSPILIKEKNDAASG
jgi:HPt (histidine-containing phosphotransfer) domain-containing protein